MFKASATWITQCEKQLHGRGAKLIKALPPKLRQEAKFVLASSKSFEWKHFWCVNAELWLQQFNLTKKLGKDWGEVHDVVFEAWNKSEHAQTFLKALNEGQSIKQASTAALNDLELQLKQLTIRHFGKPGALDKKYQTQFELGEFPVKALSATLSAGKSQIEFYSWDKKNFEKQLANISETLGLIKTYSPESYEVFCTFTRRLVPIKQKEFVSYSLQSLPGHSFINLYHRDRLDLLDDLLHENGHHHLNYFLILKNPLREDPDQIYYSPWRRTLRPVRGIYHAHLTFFFALKLYFDLSLALLHGELDFPKPLTKSEQQKVLLRYLEDWHMLEYTARDLEIAIKRGQVKPEGVKLLNAFEAERKELGTLVGIATQKLSATNKKKIKALHTTLKEQAALTRG